MCQLMCAGKEIGGPRNANAMRDVRREMKELGGGGGEQQKWGKSQRKSRKGG